MPPKEKKDRIFVRLFLSAYENSSWADAEIDWPEDRLQGAVEAVAIRKSDGKKLALEHTLVQPFLDDRQDFAMFEAAFSRFSDDPELVVPNKYVRLYLPVGLLKDQRRNRDAIVARVRHWIIENRLNFPDGRSLHPFSMDITPPIETSIMVEAYSPRRYLPGKFVVGRFSPERKFDQVIENVLKRKVEKLVRTDADKRILLLERERMVLVQEEILAEIEKQKSKFPSTASVDEIWILETVTYDKDSCLTFERWENFTQTDFYSFQGSSLKDKRENGEYTQVEPWF